MSLRLATSDFLDSHPALSQYPLDLNMASALAQLALIPTACHASAVPLSFSGIAAAEQPGLNLCDLNLGIGRKNTYYCLKFSA